MKTVTVKTSAVEKKWYLIDASGQVLGRLATVVAKHLQGKHKPEYTANNDLGDYIVIVNADKVAVTGKKSTDKIYYTHTQYPGGLKEESFAKLLARKPEEIIKRAVKGMMPRGPLGYAMLAKLKIYSGAQHEHMAQKPALLNLEG